ncbi:MAG: hypothetical protein IH865_01715 [Chloroflexi bacterium]|nr:hypothetical protein [Chloroflexota bacterium]
MRETVAFICEDMVAYGAYLRGAIRGEREQTLAEYSLIITVIAVGVVVTSVAVFRGALAGAFTTVADCITATTC